MLEMLTFTVHLCAGVEACDLPGALSWREIAGAVVFDGSEDVDEEDEVEEEELERTGAAAGNNGGVVCVPQNMPPTLSHEVSATRKK